MSPIVNYVFGIIAVIGLVILCVNTLLVILSMGAGILGIAIRILQLILILLSFLYVRVTGRQLPDGWDDKIEYLHPGRWIR